MAEILSSVTVKFGGEPCKCIDSMMVGFKAENLNSLASDPADICLKVDMECKAFKYCEFLCKLLQLLESKEIAKDIRPYMKRKVGCLFS